MSEPLYNTDNPASLIAAGHLDGKAIQVDPDTLETTSDGRIFRGRYLPTSGRASLVLNGGDAGIVAVKATEQSSARQPRNLRREAKLLAACRHPHILPLLNAYLQSTSSISDIPQVLLFTPFYPYTLRQLISAQLFTPHDDYKEAFDSLAHSICWQLLEAVRYLHSRKIAHRDVSPNNVLLSRGGRVVLADFGISIMPDDEPPGRMVFEVGTGAYRAPELLFGAKTYDAMAIDLWAAGATLAEMFTPFEAETPPTSPHPDDDDGGNAGGFSVSDWAAKLGIKVNFARAEPEKRRRALFGESRSDLALVGAIFKVRGTPTVDTWPEAAELPDWGRFDFTRFETQSLSSLLPHLGDKGQPLVDVLEQLLMFSAKVRLPAAEAIRPERWQGLELIQPDDHTEEECQGWPQKHGSRQDSLGQALSRFLP